MSSQINQYDSSISELESLLSQLSLTNEQHNLATTLPSLIYGLQSCKQAISDTTSSHEIRVHCWELVTKAGEICANSAKNAVSRDAIGSSGTIELVTGFLKLNYRNESPSSNVQCLRVLANLCINHEKNRQKTLNSGGISAILSILKHNNDLDVLRTGAGALLNAGLEYDPVNIEIARIDGLSTLSKILEPNNILLNNIENIDAARTTVHFTTRVFSNIASSDEGIKRFADGRVLSPLIHLLSHASSAKATEDDVDILENVVEILENVALDNEKVQEIIVREGLFTNLLDYLEHAKSPSENNEKLKKQYGEWKAVVLKVIVSTTMSDNNMTPLFENEIILKRFFGWLSIGPSRDDLQICADTNCVKLVHEFKVVESLVNALKTSENNIKLQHAVVGIIKNLAIPVQNKSLIGSHGIIELVSPLLDPEVIQPIQLGVIGILKHLSSGDVLNSKRIILGEKSYTSETAMETKPPTPLVRLLILTQKTDDISIRSEGTRTLVNLIKTSVSAAKTQQTHVLDVTTLRSILNTSEIIRPIYDMIIESKYPVLQNEGVIGLTLLVLDDSAKSKERNHTLYFLTNNNTQVSEPNVVDPDNSSNVASSSSTATSISPLLDSLLVIMVNNKDKYPDEIRHNVCVLLEKAIEASNDSYKKYFRDHIKKLLVPLLDPNRVRPISDTLKSDFEKLMQSLT
ncbi:8026_t:CDS:10 [Ambispora gerdemannii]|uniref:8026_t:CDS:1 n=1 Tax=Ambispora gerdemannii TaxID=144530 RepID=A0A9N8YNU4_9GLOM|nr:8026_t:CDS:10 [Ambispora gerdemannii]